MKCYLTYLSSLSRVLSFFFYYAFKLLFPGNSNCNSSICSVQADCVGNCIETDCVLSNISRAVWNVAFKINCHFKKKKRECLTVMRRKKRCVECVGRTLEWHYSLISCINISMASTGSKAADSKWTIVILLCINPAVTYNFSLKCFYKLLWPL